MAKNKPTAKERREKAKEARVVERAAKIIARKEARQRILEARKAEKQLIIRESQDPTEEELQENSKVLEGDRSNTIKKETFFSDREVIRFEKNMLQRELESFADHEIQEIPDFLTDPEKEDERKSKMDRIKLLLKRRFSLIAIADILECNSYDKLDELIERKERIYKLVEKYSGTETEKPIKLFSKLKKIVGDENSRLYAEQEERMKAVIEYIYNGKYFESSSEPREILEDVIADIIDHPDFSFACQIEAEFVSFEMERAIKVLSDLGLRAETLELIDELRAVSLESEGRAHSYEVINTLVVNYPRPIIEKNDRDDSNESR